MEADCVRRRSPEIDTDTIKKQRSPSLKASATGGGEGGIRTLGRALRPYDGLANR